MSSDDIRVGYPQIRNTDQLNDPLLLSNGSKSTTAALNNANEHKKVKRRRRTNPNLQNRKSVSESTKLAIEVAAVYIEDAIHVRKPQIKIQDKGYEYLICGKNIIMSPLRAYKFVHNKWWKLWLYFVIWVHLLVIIVAPKNYDEQRDPDSFNQINTVKSLIVHKIVYVFILELYLLYDIIIIIYSGY